MTSMKIVSFSKAPPHVHLRPKCFLPLDLGRPIWNGLPHRPLSPTNYGTATAHSMWTNEIKTKTKSNHVTFKLNTRFIVRFSPRTMQWYHSRMALLSFWLSIMSAHGANPIFFNKKNKDWTSRTLATPTPSTSGKISPHSPLPSKWTSCVYHS